jgi:undecaprenyl diphosphate synthase
VPPRCAARPEAASSVAAYGSLYHDTPCVLGPRNEHHTPATSAVPPNPPSLGSVSLLTKIRRFRAVRPAPAPELPEIARSIAIIPDGNGRWARQRRLPVAAGHRAGTKAVRRTVEAAIDLGVQSIAVYAFSTENWTRPPDEVDALMEIFGETIDRELPDLAKQGVRVRFVGRRDRASSELQEKMADMEAETAANERLDLWIAFDYGGRAELAEAARRLVDAGVAADEIDEDTFARALYAPDLPDPDLLIRTSGELRISNFLLWQLAYAELVFVETLWPDFGERELQRALSEYANRRRRFGGR